MDEVTQRLPFRSAAQRARVFSEEWIIEYFKCPSCCASLRRTPNNTVALDFVCADCTQGYELKSKRGAFGGTIVNGAYKTLVERLRSNTAPNLLLLSYSDDFRVKQMLAVPRRFFVEEIVLPRKPLGPHCRRAGWQGCNLRISALPEIGKIECVRDFNLVEYEEIRRRWRKTSFIDSMPPRGKGWLVVVMGLVSRLMTKEFFLSDLYSFEEELRALYPDNSNIKAKIRQQMQRLRDAGWVQFLGSGRYKLND